MKKIIILSLITLSFAVCSKEAVKPKKVKVAKVAEVKKDVPCDSKEDILKKLEEKKKAEAEKGKGFSLQGGDTGCSIK